MKSWFSAVVPIFVGIVLTLIILYFFEYIYLILFIILGGPVFRILTSFIIFRLTSLEILVFLIPGLLINWVLNTKKRLNLRFFSLILLLSIQVIIISLLIYTRCIDTIGIVISCKP